MTKVTNRAGRVGSYMCTLNGSISRCFLGRNRRFGCFDEQYVHLDQVLSPQNYAASILPCPPMCSGPNGHEGISDSER